MFGTILFLQHVSFQPSLIPLLMGVVLRECHITPKQYPCTCVAFSGLRSRLTYAAAGFALWVQKSKTRSFILGSLFRNKSLISLLLSQEREFGIETTGRQKMLLAIAACTFRYKAFKLFRVEMIFTVIRLNTQMKKNKSSTFSYWSCEMRCDHIRTSGREMSVINEANHTF